MNAPRAARGFTLIEIIVVVLVFSVMSVMAYGGLTSVLRTRQGIERSMQRTADIQRAFQRLRGDFQNLRDRSARDSYGDAQASFALDRDGVLSLIRGGRRNPLQAGRSSLERVSYRLENRALLRASWPAVDLPQEAKPVERPLLADVEELRWRFLDAAGQWQTRWPKNESASGALSASAAEPPPMAVELILVTKDWGEMRLLFRTPIAGLARGGATGSDGIDASAALITDAGLLPGAALGLDGTQAPATTADDAEPDTDAPATDDDRPRASDGGEEPAEPPDVSTPESE